jgi:hypothetical protein
MTQIATLALVVALTYAVPSIAANIAKADAVTIALREAGCRKANDCDVRGGLKDGKWVFVVWFVMGRNADGSPQFAPGGWVGLTLNAKGEVIDRMPGA